MIEQMIVFYLHLISDSFVKPESEGILKIQRFFLSICEKHEMHVKRWTCAVKSVVKMISLNFNYKL